MKKLHGTLTNQHSETPPFKVRWEGEQWFKPLLDLEDREVFRLEEATATATLVGGGLKFEIFNGYIGDTNIEYEEDLCTS